MLQDPAVAMQSASMNFLVHGTKKPARVRLFIVSDKTEKLSKKREKKNAKQIRYEMEFETPASTDWISVRFSDLKLSKGENVPFEQVAQTVTAMGFELIDGDADDDVQFLSTINFGLDIATENLPSFIDSMMFRPTRFESVLDTVSPATMKALLKKFVANMENPTNQKHAVDIVNEGLPSIRKELSQYGWKVNTEFTGKTEMANVIRALAARDLFYEGGDFGPIHGAFAHHAQFIAGFRSLTPYEVTLMTDFIRYAIADTADVRRWGIWNALFDSRGSGVNSNRYWRDLIDGSTK